MEITSIPLEPDLPRFRGIPAILTKTDNIQRNIFNESRTSPEEGIDTYTYCIIKVFAKGELLGG